MPGTRQQTPPEDSSLSVFLHIYFLPYKSGDIKEEAANSKKAVKILGGSIEDIISFEIPDTDMARTILKIHKTKATPKRFPRKAGLPTKEPIC